MRIIFAGSIGRGPLGGHAWAQLQYLLGFRELGHDIVYLEDSGPESWVYDWKTERPSNDVRLPVADIRASLESVAPRIPWIYRVGERAFGMQIDAFREACSQADLLFIRGLPIELWREEYDLPPRRVYLDVDPGFTQMRLENGHPSLQQTVERCERLFSIGRGIGTRNGAVSGAGRRWIETVPPVSLPSWPADCQVSTSCFSSIMHWRGYPEVEYRGRTFGAKDREFLKFIELPLATAQRFRVALSGAPADALSARGWEVVPGWIATRTAPDYRSFIRSSRAEFGVAKHGYVALRTGWFSDRSVCYLASGKPILVQDTGQGDWLPTGEGILTFEDLPGAIRGIESINAAYGQHCRVARSLAEEHFSAEHVLNRLLEAAFA